MPPTHPTEVTRALDKMDEALRELGRRYHRQRRSEDFKKGKEEARQQVAETLRKWRNLKRVIEALRGAEIEYAIVSGTEIAHADKRAKPPKIRIMETYRAMRTEVLAQVLAHEAIHLLTNSRTNSIDQEIRCRKKEIEVWELLKDKGDPNPLDYICNSTQKWLEDEDRYRVILRGVYRGIPEHDEPIPPPKKKKRGKGRMRIERARSMPVELFGHLREFSGNVVHTLFSGGLTRQAYTFDAAWPAGFESHESSGHDSAYTGVVGIRSSGREHGFPTLLAVYEAPDVIQGGAWGSYSDRALWQRAVLEDFNADVLDVEPEILHDERCEVLGHPGHCLETEFLVLDWSAGADDPWVRVRDRTLYTQRGDMQYSVTLCAEPNEWESQLAALEELLTTLSLPEAERQVADPGAPEDFDAI